MEKLKDSLPGLPEVGFHRWQSYLSLFSLKRPNLGFSGQRWAFPLRWCKGGLKRLYLALFAKGGLFSFGSPYFARGGLPSLAVLEDGAKDFRGFKAAKVGFFGFDGAKVGFHRWQSSRLPELAELPKVGFSPLVLNDCQRWASLALNKPYFGLLSLPYIFIRFFGPLVGFSYLLYML